MSVAGDRQLQIPACAAGDAEGDGGTGDGAFLEASQKNFPPSAGYDIAAQRETSGQVDALRRWRIGPTASGLFRNLRSVPCSSRLPLPHGKSGRSLCRTMRRQGFKVSPAAVG